MRVFSGVLKNDGLFHECIFSHLYQMLVHALCEVFWCHLFEEGVRFLLLFLSLLLSLLEKLIDDVVAQLFLHQRGQHRLFFALKWARSNVVHTWVRDWAWVDLWQLKFWWVGAHLLLFIKHINLRWLSIPYTLLNLISSLLQTYFLVTLRHFDAAFDLWRWCKRANSSLAWLDILSHVFILSLLMLFLKEEKRCFGLFALLSFLEGHVAHHVGSVWLFSFFLVLHFIVFVLKEKFTETLTTCGATWTFLELWTGLVDVTLASLQ